MLGALVTLGWFTIPDDTINTITIAIGALVSVALTRWTRRKVTGLARPRNAAHPVRPAD